MARMLDKRSPVPLYHQLRIALVDRIQQGEWKPHEKLPTEDELGALYGVSKATVRQALQEMVQADLVRREQGRGTFVADSKVQFGPRDLSSFTEEMRDFGLRSASKILDQRVIEADCSLAVKLSLDEGSPVYRLERLRMAAGQPMGLQTVCVPCGLAPALLDTDFSVNSLYETLERKFGLIADHATQTHFAVALDGRQAGLLQVAEGSPALGGERLTFLRGGQPLEITQSVMRADRYQIQLKLVRGGVSKPLKGILRSHS
ncbi:MAG: GntR family transcriptional regulator [Bryobacterales bacterium]|nr:GntR family transcriptional regulator [Bryobacterales bacterium]